MDQKQLSEEFMKYKDFVYDLVNKQKIHNLHLLAMEKKDLIQECNLFLVRALLDCERHTLERLKNKEKCRNACCIDSLRKDAKSYIKRSRRALEKKEELNQYIDSVKDIEELKKFVNEELLKIGKKSTYIYMYIKCLLINIGKRIMTQKRLPGMYKDHCKDEEGNPKPLIYYNFSDIDWNNY